MNENVESKIVNKMSKVQTQSTNVTKITTHKYTMNHAESVILISLGHY